MRSLVTVVLALAGIACWGLGSWRIYESGTTVGAVLALVGAVLLIVAFAVWKREPSGAATGIVNSIIEFLGRG